MKTVFVGLSGGVDSAVSAYLLKKQGYRVVGAFIKGWEPDFLPCTGKEDRLSAMQVAAHLKIPFVTYDLEEEYKKSVVDSFVSEYEAGRTPNPDVLCNREIKFGAFWEKAKTDGADFIATGHYAQIGQSGGLKTSADPDKDQTYFLWTLTKDDLSHTLFPVGRFAKNEVRLLGAEADLPNARRPDSQGLCFLGHVDMRAFLKRYIPSKKGDIVDGSGNKIGEHDGVAFYTLGEHAPLSGAGERRYIVAKDVARNTLTTSLKTLPQDPKNRYNLQRLNWSGPESQETKVHARYRYRQTLIPAVIKGMTIAFDSPQLIAPGQSCVFYGEDGEVFGGAIII